MWIKRYLSVDAEIILDYISGECGRGEMFQKNKRDFKTTNAHNRVTYQKEFESYLKEWGYNYE